MHKAQIYFEKTLFEEIKAQANILGLSMSAYVRDALKKDLQEKKKIKQKPDFSDFAGMWKDRDISQESIRKMAWK